MSILALCPFHDALDASEAAIDERQDRDEGEAEGDVEEIHIIASIEHGTGYLEGRVHSAHEGASHHGKAESNSCQRCRALAPRCRRTPR